MPKGDIPLPVEPGPWHFRQSVEYSQTANWAVLDYASRNADHLLFNIWQMGQNSIERGNTDSWTTLPFEIDAAAEAMDRGIATIGSGFFVIRQTGIRAASSFREINGTSRRRPSSSTRCSTTASMCIARPATSWSQGRATRQAPMS